MHPALLSVTERIVKRSAETRAAYLARREEAAAKGVRRKGMSCGNLAHAFAACTPEVKAEYKGGQAPVIGIVSAYNDILSAHQPYETYPALIKQAAAEYGAIAQFAGGVPAMCDGVTQGAEGMELSLFSRDVIALSAGVALSHNLFDGALYLGICDKIVPGMMMAALSFGHIPAVFVPGGPMQSGLPNQEKARVRQRFAQGEASREELLEAEAASYHSPGTCTFYGTANSNQMLMEIMGMQLPGSSFVNPGTKLRDALTRAAVKRVIGLPPLYRSFSEKNVVNGIVGLLATGGSTNHTIHLVAIARAAGILIDWDDFAALSKAVPLLCRIYPGGEADVNRFHAAGGTGKVIADLLSAGLLHREAGGIMGDMAAYTREPKLVRTPSLKGEGITQSVSSPRDREGVIWEAAPEKSLDTSVLADISAPFGPEGGLCLLRGNLGRAVMRTSGVKPEHRIVEAPARVFTSQAALQAAFKRGELGGDFIAVLLFQGPSANGMPELHALTPLLGVLQDLGQHVALVTDGRMSGASGKVPAAIHVTPECVRGGALAKLRDGDLLRLDAVAGTLDVLADEKEFAARPQFSPDLSGNEYGTGRELFAHARTNVTSAEEGASFVV